MLNLSITTKTLSRHHTLTYHNIHTSVCNVLELQPLVSSINYNYKRMHSINLTDAWNVKGDVLNTSPERLVYSGDVFNTSPWSIIFKIVFSSMFSTLFRQLEFTGNVLSLVCRCALCARCWPVYMHSNLASCHSDNTCMHPLIMEAIVKLSTKTPLSLFCYACDWSNVLNRLSHVDHWPCALVALKAEHIIYIGHITHQLQMYVSSLFVQFRDGRIGVYQRDPNYDLFIPLVVIFRLWCFAWEL